MSLSADTKRRIENRQLPERLDNSVFWLVFGSIILLAGFVQGLLGFGFAVVALAILPFWLTNIHEAIVVLTLSTPLPIAWAFWEYRRDVLWQPLVRCLAGAAIGLPCGLYVFTHIGADLLTRATGLVLALICFDSLVRSRNETSVAHRWYAAPFAGLISGFLAGAVGLPGPPLIVYASSAGWAPRRFRAFSLAFFTITSFCRSAGVFALDQVDSSILALTGVAIPLVWLGHYFGAKSFDRIDAKLFRRLVYALLIFSAVNMLLRGAGGETGGNQPHAVDADVTAGSGRSVCNLASVEA